MSGREPSIGLPHRGRARLLRSVIARDDSSLQGVGVIPEDHPLARDGGASLALGIELAAQAVAARLGGAAPGAGGGGAGRLVGVRDVAWHAEHLPVGRELEVSVEEEGRASPLAVHRFVVSVDGVALADGTVSTHAGTP